MRLRRLLRTSAVRLALRYALLYVGVTALVLGAVYWSISRFVDSEIAAGLHRSADALQRAHERMTPEQFRSMVETEIVGTSNAFHILLTNAQGRILAGDLTRWPSQALADNQVTNLTLDADVFPSSDHDHEEVFCPVLATTLPNGDRLLVADDQHQVEDLLDFTQGTMTALLVVSLALALGLGLLQGRGLLKRIDGLIETADAIGAGRLNQRIPLSGRDDEFDELAEQLNRMLERIEALLRGMRQVTDNVAHDLRRPLSRVRNLLEVTSMGTRQPAEYQDVLKRAIIDLDELIHTFHALMEVAQAEAGSFRGDWPTLDLGDLVTQLGELYGDLAEEQGRSLQVEVTPNAQVTGDRHLLTQAIANLLDNALKFSPPGSSIQLSLTADNGRVQLSVTDRGPGIAPEQRQRVLQRFVRLDAARSTPGNGLGLSLVAAVAHMHRAELTLADAEPGLRVELDFEARQGPDQVLAARPQVTQEVVT